MAAKPKSSVIPFTPRARPQEEELPVGLPPAAASGSGFARPPAAASAVDLSGKPKVWFVIGPGRSGKSMFLRWAAELSLSQGGQPILAAADPQNRSLRNFLDVHEPPTNDAAAVAAWQESLLNHAMDQKMSAMIDLGGGDTSLQRLLETVPSLASDLEASGVHPVAIYLLGPRVDDLASLASFEAMGFQPTATALICNTGLMEGTGDRESAFERVRQHSAYRAAVERGAVSLWMPALRQDLVRDIDALRWNFQRARDAVDGVALGPFDRSRVRTWLEAMSAELLPVLSWLP
jgi:hypothetical protein